jgi:cysteine synthase A
LWSDLDYWSEFSIKDIGVMYGVRFLNTVARGFHCSIVVAVSAVSFSNRDAPLPTTIPHVHEGNDSRVATGILDAIGDTPLIELKTIGAALGCRILAKAEHMNPGGSVKDRAALRIVDEFERQGLLVPRNRRAAGHPVGTIVEATGGNTGIGLALVAAARGYKCVFTMPDKVSPEKVAFAEMLGARVVLCPADLSFADPRHYYQHAKTLVRELGPGAVLGNQFETEFNWRAHYESTGPEILRQTGGAIDAVVVSAGTGGTIGGLSRFFRENSPATRMFLIDPPGSSLYRLVTAGALEATPNPTKLAEGVGIGRLTANFSAARVDNAFVGSDQEIVDMAYFLLRNEGLLVGPSAALNVVGAVKAARLLGPGATVVTVICDGGERYRGKLFNRGWLLEQGLTAPALPANSDLPPSLDFVK